MNNLVQKFQNGKNIGRWFYHGQEVFSNDGGKTFIIDDKGNYVQPGVNKSLVRADRVISNAYKSGNNWFHIGTGQKVTRFKNTTPSNNQQKSIATPNEQQRKITVSPNSQKNQTSQKTTPKVSQSNTTVVNSQQKRNVPSTLGQPKSSRSNILVRKPNNGFSQAWNNARNQGLAEFIWNGGRYNTRKAGETDEQYNTYLNSFRKPVEDRTNLYDVITVPDTSAMQNYNVSNNQELLNTLSSSVPKYRLEQPLPSLQTIISKPLSQLTFAKKGTKLISRNPIERFKNK